MKVNELVSSFQIFTSGEEKEVLERLHAARLLSDFSEREQVIIENLIRKSLVIKIGTNNTKVIANEL